MRTEFDRTCGLLKRTWGGGVLDLLRVMPFLAGICRTFKATDVLIG